MAAAVNDVNTDMLEKTSRVEVKGASQRLSERLLLGVLPNQKLHGSLKPLTARPASLTVDPSTR